MITIGDYRVFSVVNGFVRLDGGAMFGVVPKVLWERKTKPDEYNRILLAMRSLVAVNHDASRVVIVDTGAGDKWPADEAARFAVESRPDALREALAPHGLTEDDVTDVVISHLHFDHNGGVTEWAREAGGPTRLRFKNARHWVHERHWRHANDPCEKDRASFLERDLEALGATGALELVSGDDPPPPFDGVRWLISSGHTPSQLLPIFQDPNGDLLFVGDLIPTADHLPIPWVMAYDLEPLRTLAEKREVYRRCTQEGLLLAFPHDPRRGGVGLEMVGDKPVVTRSLDL